MALIRAIWLVAFPFVVACFIPSTRYYVVVPENHVFFSKEVIKEGRKDNK